MLRMDKVKKALMRGKMAPAAVTESMERSLQWIALGYHNVQM